MARDAVEITALGMDAFTDAPAGTAINATNGAIINAAGNTDNLLLEITHTGAAAKDITIVAPVGNDAAVRSPLGSLVVEFGIGSETPVVKYVVLESARFAQADGSIHIDFEASAAGTVRAFRLPRGA